MAKRLVQLVVSQASLSAQSPGVHAVHHLTSTGRSWNTVIVTTTPALPCREKSKPRDTALIRLRVHDERSMTKQSYKPTEISRFFKRPSKFLSVPVSRRVYEIPAWSELP